VVAAPLAVAVGLKLPQAEAGVQDQVTPWFRLSLATVATTLAWALTFMDDGGGALRVTAIPAPAALMVTLADAKALVFDTDVAVMVTGLVLGTVAGAV
jgi:hypothetical protein